MNKREFGTTKDALPFETQFLVSGIFREGGILGNRSCSAVTFYSISEQHFLFTADFHPVEFAADFHSVEFFERTEFRTIKFVSCIQ